MRSYNILTGSRIQGIMILLTSLGWLFSVVTPMSAQTTSPDLTVQVSGQIGTVFPTNSFLKGQNSQIEPIREFRTGSLAIAWQTTGNALWQQVYRFPRVGAGIYLADFGEARDELGLPFAVYGFFSAPFVRGPRLSFCYDLRLGMAFHWKPFNPVSNPNNISIGAKQSVYVDAGLHLEYVLTPNLTMELGGSLSHFSNGALKKPNFGINTIAPRISLNYRPNPHPYTRQDLPSPEHQPLEWCISGFYGQTNVVFDSLNLDIIEKYEGENFPTIGLSASVNQQLGFQSKIGLGMTAEYHTYYGAVASVVNNDVDIESSDSLKNHLAISAFPSFELTIARLSILLQPSWYLYRSRFSDGNPVFYQRVGLKYYLNEHLFVGANLRAFDFHVSDFIEWNVGVSL